MKHLLILGGSSPIGLKCINQALESDFFVTSIGRKKINIKNKKFSFKKINFQFKNNWKKIFLNINKKNSITHLIFLQRSRENKINFLKEMNISINPVVELIKEFFKFNLKNKNIDNKSIMIFTSPIVNMSALEQPLTYHVSKAILNQLIKYFSVYLGKINCNINGLSPDIIFKERAKKFFKKNKDLKRLINKIIPLKKMATTDEIAQIAMSLLDSKFNYLNGQIITLDGGLSSHTHSSLARFSKNFINDEIDFNKLNF
jgi:hypothetical protein